MIKTATHHTQEDNDGDIQVRRNGKNILAGWVINDGGVWRVQMGGDIKPRDEVWFSDRAAVKFVIEQDGGINDGRY